MKTLLLAFILHAPVAYSQSRQDTVEVFRTIEHANDLCTSRSGSCLNSPVRPQPNPRRVIRNIQESGVGIAETASATSAAPNTQTVIKDIHGRSLPITVIPEERILRLKENYPPLLRVYDDRVCAARAHILGDTLAKNGIESVKLMVRPKSSWFFSNYVIPDDRARNNWGTTPQWEFHVGNMVYAQKKDGSLVQYIIDPFMESYPVPRAKWEARLRSNPKSSIGSIDVVSRYVVDDKDLKRTDLNYDQIRLNRSYEIMNGL